MHVTFTTSLANPLSLSLSPDRSSYLILMEKKMGVESVHQTRPAPYKSNRKGPFPSRGSIKSKIFIFVCGKIKQRILGYLISST